VFDTDKVTHALSQLQQEGSPRSPFRGGQAVCSMRMRETAGHARGWLNHSAYGLPLFACQPL
jgi:hypothetical protein